MTKKIIFAVIIVFSFLIGLYFELKRRKSLRPYWDRSCAGKEWTDYCPNCSKEAIRDFLSIFVASFLFKPKQRLKFKPTDRIMDIYHAIYPDKCMADTLELEDFALRLKKKYGIDLYSVSNNNITLGEIFKITQEKAQQIAQADRD